jgi:hypothetical protein
MAYVLREIAKFAAGLVMILGWLAATFMLVITARLMTIDEEWRAGTSAWY